MPEDLIVNTELTIPATELKFKSSRSSGPGGQNVNKVESKVELRFNVGNSTVLSEEVRARLLILAVSKLDSEGNIQIVVQESRSKIENLAIARAKLRELLIAALKKPKKRKKTRPSELARKKNRRDKERRSSIKKMRKSRGAEGE